MRRIVIRVVMVAVMVVPAFGIAAAPASSQTTQLFTDNFSSGLTGWTTGGQFNSWGTATEPDGNIYASDSPSGNYDIGVNAWMLSKTTLNLTGYGTCTATAQTVLDVDSGDALHFEVSGNGTTWQSVANWSGSTSGLWQARQADLSAYVGQTKLYFRYRFQTDGYEQLSGNDGVSIDNVAVSCTPAAVASPSPTPTQSGGSTNPSPTPTPTPTTSAPPASTRVNGPLVWARGMLLDNTESELWRAEADGSGALQLTGDSVRDTYPHFSPDGARLVWARGSDGTQGIFVAPIAGGSATRLTSAGFCGGANLCHNHPRWSPNGKKIAFQHSLDTIVVMNPDGTGVRSFSFEGLMRGISWAPDSTKLVFAGLGNSESDYELYRVNADGTGQTRLTNNTWDEQTPAWSPDGTKIAYVSDYSSGGQILAAGVFVMNADGTGQLRITGSQDWDDSNPTWSPDGKRIAFSSNRADNNREIFTMNADGSDVVRITTDPLPDDFPTWGAACDATCQQQAVERQASATQIVKIKKPNRTTIKVVGLVSPPHDGRTVSVALARKIDGSFKTIATAKAKLFHLDGYDDISVFAASLKRPAAGTCRVKVTFPADDDHKASRASKVFSC